MGRYTLDDFLSTLVQIRRLRRLGAILRFLPGMRLLLREAARTADTDRDLARVQGIIHSMTREERRASRQVIDASRRRRIAAGCGRSMRDVDELLRQFEAMAEMMQRTGRDSL